MAVPVATLSALINCMAEKLKYFQINVLLGLGRDMARVLVGCFAPVGWLVKR